MFAALFVVKNGPYFGLPEVDPWDEDRDALNYRGPHPVIAHPPCERWGRYWAGGPSAKVKRKMGDDNGCFQFALSAVRKYGGVLEHPEATHAWRCFDINTPPRSGYWISADFSGGWTCCVEQGHYGHKARKATWLYAVNVDIPQLKWGKAPGVFNRLDDGYHSKEERALATRAIATKRLSTKERLETPKEFRDILISIARSANQKPALTYTDKAGKLLMRKR